MQKKEKIILVWYKRDLRISDHMPLSEAMKSARSKGISVVAFYSFEPRVVEAPDFSLFHRQFIEDSLIDLSKSLVTLSVPFLVFTRSLSDTLKSILEQYDIEHIYSHEETGNAITYERDIMMGKYLRSRDIPWTEYPTN